MSMTKANKQSGFLANIKEIIFLLVVVWIIRTWGFGLYVVPTGSMETTMLAGERFFSDKFTPLFSNIKRGEIIAFNDATFVYSKNPIVRLFQEYVWGPINVTKRVIGIPGDEVKGVIEDGRPVIYLNGKKLDEPYLNKYPILRVWKVDLMEVARVMNQDRNKVWDLISIKSFDPKAPLDHQPFYDIKQERIIMEGSQLSVLYPGTPIRPEKKNVHQSNGKNIWSGSDEFYVKLDDNQYWVMGDNRLGSKDSRFFGPIDGRLIHGRITFRILSIDTDGGWPILDFIKHPIDFWKRVRWRRCLQKVS